MSTLSALVWLVYCGGGMVVWALRRLARCGVRDRSG